MKVSDERDDARQAMQVIVSGVEVVAKAHARRREIEDGLVDRVLAAIERLDAALRRFDERAKLLADEREAAIARADAAEQDRRRWINENADLGEELAKAREVNGRLATRIRSMQHEEAGRIVETLADQLPSDAKLDALLTNAAALAARKP